MLHIRKNNNKIKHLNESLQTIKYDKKSSYEKKVKHKLCSEISRDMIMEEANNQYNLRNHTDLITPHINSVIME